jgi:hypothetical protein
MLSCGIPMVNSATPNVHESGESRCQICCNPLYANTTGGIAALSPRLMAVTPPGSHKQLRGDYKLGRLQ